MADELEYVVHGALMICDKGTAPGFFNPTYNAKTKVGGCLVTTAMDKLPITNIPSFTVCSISQKPCIPVPTEWEKTCKVKVQSQETLLARSCIQCALGGKIEFVTSGQVSLPQDAMDDIKAMQEAGAKPEEDDSWGWWDTAELIPVVGSVIGIFREAKKGNWLMSAANVGFLISDVAGVISFGATTAASTAGKTALKSGVKVAGKSATKAAAKKVGKTGIKTGLKITAKEAKEKFVSKIDEIVKFAKSQKKGVKTKYKPGTKYPDWKGPVDYSNITDPKNAGKGKKFTKGQKDQIYQKNKSSNNGYLVSDKDGTILEASKKSQKGVTPSKYESQVDHIEPRSKGGENKGKNAQVLSREQNREKWDK